MEGIYGGQCKFKLNPQSLAN